MRKGPSHQGIQGLGLTKTQ